MKDYSDCIEYLHELGIPIDACERIYRKYKDDQDMEGLLDYILLCEAMVDSCVD